MTIHINRLGKLIAGVIGILGVILAIVGFLMAYAVIKNREYFILIGLVVPFLMAFLIIIYITSTLEASHGVPPDRDPFFTFPVSCRQAKFNI